MVRAAESVPGSETIFVCDAAACDCCCERCCDQSVLFDMKAVKPLLVALCFIGTLLLVKNARVKIPKFESTTITDDDSAMQFPSGETSNAHLNQEQQLSSKLKYKGEEYDVEVEETTTTTTPMQRPMKLATTTTTKLATTTVAKVAPLKKKPPTHKLWKRKRKPKPTSFKVIPVDKFPLNKENYRLGDATCARNPSLGYERFGVMLPECPSEQIVGDDLPGLSTCEVFVKA